MKYLREIIFALLVFEVVFIGALAFGNQGNGVCLVDVLRSSNETTSSCSGVWESQYGALLGVKVATFGFWSFLILAFVGFYSMYVDKKKYFAYLVLTLIGSLFAVYFLSLQFFVLKQICSSCLVIDIGMLVIFGLSYLRYNE